MAVVVATGALVGAVLVTSGDPPPDRDVETVVAQSMTSPGELSGSRASPLELRACQAQITAGEAAAEAAHQSFADWSAHVQAQVDLDAGRIAEDTAWEIWLDTKARGTSDLASFKHAVATYQQLKGSCAALLAKAAGTGGAPNCVSRGALLEAVVTAGETMNADWDRHVQMMEAMGTASMGYNQMWRSMVASAPRNLEPFKVAYDGLAGAPACVLTG
jgi:hypothetical protein